MIRRLRALFLRLFERRERTLHHDVVEVVRPYRRGEDGH